MMQRVLALTAAALCSLVHSPGVQASVGHLAGVAAVPAPVVTAASSQYFERTFNRLVAAHPVLEPVFPVAPVAPVAPAPTVFVEPVTRTLPAVPTVPAIPTQNVPVEPNVAIAVATAHAAAPVATILLPPYPFGVSPSFGFVPPIAVPDQKPKNEITTSSPNTPVRTSIKEPEATTPFPSPSNTDNNFVQALPSNQNTNFKQYYAPPLPQPLPKGKPQKLKTSVEVVPQPLAYIAPPAPLHHHHHHHHHGHPRPLKYVHSFVPAKLVLRPVSVHSVRVPARLVLHKAPVLVRKYPRNQKVLISRVGDARDTEPTTFRPLNRPVTKPPKI